MVNGIYQWRKRRNSGLTEIYFKKPIKNDWLIYTKDLSVCPTLPSFSSSKNTSFLNYLFCIYCFPNADSEQPRHIISYL